MPDIAFDNVLVYANGGCEVASRPQGVRFVQSVLAFDLLFEPSGRFPFQYLEDIGNRVSRGCQDAEVGMIVLDTELDDFPVFPFAYGFEDSSQFVFHFVRCEYLTSVFRRPNEVVFQIVETM